MKKYDKLFKYLPWAILAITFISTFVYVYLNFGAYVDSDMASEMILANLLNQEGDLITSQNWMYSSEIRIFYVQIFYRLTLLLFPDNWYKARIVGNALLMICLLLSYFFITGKNGLNLKNKGVWGAICLSMPFGLWYFWYGVFGGFYFPHMILTLLSLGLALRMINSNSKKSLIIYSILLAIVCFISGLGGVKGIMSLYAPLLLCLLVLLIYRFHFKKDEYKTLNLHNIVATLIGLLFSF